MTIKLTDPEISAGSAAIRWTMMNMEAGHGATYLNAVEKAIEEILNFRQKEQIKAAASAIKLAHNLWLSDEEEIERFGLPEEMAEIFAKAALTTLLGNNDD